MKLNLKEINFLQKCICGVTNHKWDKVYPSKAKIYDKLLRQKEALNNSSHSGLYDKRAFVEILSKEYRNTIKLNENSKGARTFLLDKLWEAHQEKILLEAKIDFNLKKE